MITGFLISLVSLTGYIFSAHYWLKVPFRLCPLFSVTSVMIILFWAALTETLLPATVFLLGCGSVLCVVILLLKLQGETVLAEKYPRDGLFILLGLVTIALFCALTGHLSVVDDYAYWAIVSKSIEMFDSLPTAETTIFARHLTYTPGLALFHYYFFTAFSEYQPNVAYFAQNLFLISLLFALTDQQNRRISLTLISVTVILLVLFSGSVFQKLRVDHFLSLTSCVILWSHLRQPFSLPRLLVIATTICCLYLIKEVGFLLALFLLLAVILDLIYATNMQPREKKTAIILCLLLCLYLFGQKFFWDSHCTTLGFNQFHSGISLKTTASAFNLAGNDESRHGFFIFLKSLLVGPADRLKIPYFVWYLLLGFLWHSALKRFPKVERNRYYRLFCLTLPVFWLYLAMNFTMQVIIFGLGTTSDVPTSLPRYVNIFLSWFIMFTVATSLVCKLSAKQAVTSRWPVTILIVAGLLLAGSSLPGKLKPYERDIEQLWPKLAEHLDTDSQVCITPGKKEDHYLGFRLLYHLLPTSFTVDPFPGRSGTKNLEQKLATCDYLLVYLPDQQTRQMFSPFTADHIKHRSLFKVTNPTAATGTLSLQRIH